MEFEDSHSRNRVPLLSAFSIEKHTEVVIDSHEMRPADDSQSLELAGKFAIPHDRVDPVYRSEDAKGPQGGPELTRIKSRLVDCPVQQLQPHPSYARHKLTVHASQLGAIENQGEMALQYPIIITGERFIIDGYARWELAKRQNRSTLPCLEYDIAEDDALQLLIQTHRRAHGLNDFIRIQLALDMEPQLNVKALLNRQQGGRLKVLSKLTEAEKVDSRKEIARVAQVSSGNVHKVKYILAHACSLLKEAARTGEISINLAEKWSHKPESKQQENLRLVRISRGLRKKARNLVTAQIDLSPQLQLHTIKVADLLKLVHQLSVIFPQQSNELGSIEVKFVQGVGRAILVPQELLSHLAFEQRSPDA